MTESVNPQVEFEAALGPAMIKEDQCREYKTSAFVAPGDHKPGARQMKTIADTLAAFMNAEGGILFIGVSDDYKSVGIENDLKILEHSTSQVKVSTPRLNDKAYSYKGTQDSYELKLRAIIRGFLSDNALPLIERISFHLVASVLVCRVICLPCKPGDWVYSYDTRINDLTHKLETSVDIYVRFGNQKLLLKGEARDNFIRDRVKMGIATQLEAFGSQSVSTIVDSVKEMLTRLKGRQLVGTAVAISGAHPFTEEAVSAAKKPKSLAWDGAHYTDVSSWKDLILKVLLKVQEVNPAAFDQMVEDKVFSKHLIRVTKPRERHSDCFAEKFGTQENVRIKTALANKTYLYREDYVLRKLLAVAQIDATRFLFTAE